MKSSENHYSFIRSGRNGSLLLIFNILGIEPSSYFIFGKVEGRYLGTVIELTRGFAKNKTLQMSHMIKRTHPLTLMSERSRTFHHQSVSAWIYFTLFGLYAVKVFSKMTFWPGERHSGGCYNKVLVLLQIGFSVCSCLPTGSVGFHHYFWWWTILRLYFNFLNQSAKLVNLLLVRNDKLFNDVEQFWTWSHRQQPCALVFCVNLYWQRQEIISTHNLKYLHRLTF